MDGDVSNFSSIIYFFSSLLVMERWRIHENLIKNNEDDVKQITKNQTINNIYTSSIKSGIAYEARNMSPRRLKHGHLLRADFISRSPSLDGLDNSFMVKKGRFS